MHRLTHAHSYTIVGELLGDLTQDLLKWGATRLLYAPHLTIVCSADGKLVMDEWQAQIKALLGERTEEDKKAGKKVMCTTAPRVFMTH